tara:strand:+ start:460 stop:645 length:186 start_codon:yes stop_codon:yes gene_type:complete
MNTAYKIMTGKDVSKDELKYLLFLTLAELSWSTSNEIVGLHDEEECFNMDDLLESLEKKLK